MGEREALIKGIEKFKKEVSEKRKVERVILFGSRAGKRHRKDSDVDLIIVSPYFKRKKFGRAEGLHRHWRLDYPVDFLCYTPEEFKKLSRQVSIVSEALKSGITI